MSIINYFLYKLKKPSQFLLTIVIIACSHTTAFSFSCPKNSDKVLFDNATWYGEINCANLVVKGKQKHEKIMRVLADTPMHLGQVKELRCNSTNASWYYPDLNIHVKLSMQEDRLVFEYRE